MSPPGAPTPSASSNKSNRPSAERASRYSLHSQANPPNEGRNTRSPTIGGIANGMEDMNFGLETPQSASPSPQSRLHPEFSNLNRASPEATRRRRSPSPFTPPHDVAEEEPPQERFYERKFQESFSNAKQLMADLASVLASSFLHDKPDSTMRTLYQQASDPKSFPTSFYPHCKSSLINSLLDVKELARASNSGGACTCVVTEYHYHDETGFAIEPEYFTINEVKDQLTELLWSYRLHHSLRNDPSQEGIEQRKALEDKARRAHDTFRAAFRNHTMQDKFLFNERESVVLETFLTWAKESCAQLREGSDGVKNRAIITDAKQCSSQLMELMSELGSLNKPLLWPFIRKVKVYLKAHILSKGLILVDLPGLHDLNAARLKITKRYVLDCDEIFAVCYIGRATTDAGVKGVFELAKRAKLSNIRIICTKSDDVEAKECEKDWGHEAAKTIRTISAKIEIATQELEDIKEMIEYLTYDTSADEELDYKELVVRQSQVEKQLREDEFKLTSYLINTRNEKVKQSLQLTYQTEMTGSTPKVFCVSNTEYWKNRHKPKGNALPSLYLSGILDVRKECISIVAESQLRAATEYMKNTIPALLGSIELWVQSGSVQSGSVRASTERKQSIRDVLDKIKHELDGWEPPALRINVMIQSMERCFRTRTPDTMEKHELQWSQAAGKATLEWNGWHPPTFAAFCRNYGDWDTDAVGPHCWNYEVIEKMVTDMRAPWEEFCQDIKAQQGKRPKSAEDAFDRAIVFSNDSNNRDRSLETLTTNLEHRRDIPISSIEQLCLELEKGLSSLKTEAFSGIEASIIAGLMEPSYRDSIKEKGSCKTSLAISRCQALTYYKQAMEVIKDVGISY
ncbi:hypothetical protein AOQ84DRAFT_374565 [Glonium stellatum]|uniref:Uncharacterized protein n=1 Tax=Glonium stellatum TaxID=574774 RepID=A0A8E2F595_9PEZI|nr:hypothetical protein AOQ84DRAFT_374565 [Glonium stellatum]